EGEGRVLGAQDPARSPGPESRHGADQRAFPGPRLALDQNLLAAAHDHLGALDHGCAVVLGQREVLEMDSVVGAVAQHDRAARPI
ncbi:MAG: hypothetical protein AVDCRST_MAG90-688, partial [uncultured Microvirga sp.]